MKKAVKFLKEFWNGLGPIRQFGIFAMFGAVIGFKMFIDIELEAGGNTGMLPVVSCFLFVAGFLLFEGGEILFPTEEPDGEDEDSKETDG